MGKNMNRSVTCTALMLCLVVAAESNAEQIKREDLPALLSDCDQARQAKLKPARENQIAKCLERGKQAEYCERRYRDYGERVHRLNSDNVTGLFWDLPICEKAIAAQRYFGRNPAQDTFEYQPR